MKKFIHTTQRKAELAAAIRGYNYKIRRAAALKAHGKYEGVVLPKLLNPEKEFTEITTLEEYNELLNRIRETGKAVRQEKFITLGKYKTIETQTTRIIKKQQERSIQSFIQNETPAKTEFKSAKALKQYMYEYQKETLESFNQQRAEIFRENAMNALRALDLMDLVQEFNHLTLLQIDSLSRAWPESVEALWAAYESNDPTQSQEAYDRMRTAINGVKGK
jgi:predicted transcriptional regulator